jgi:acetyl esterase/lipase
LDQFNQETPRITSYLLKGKGPFPVVIVCPGGSYTHHADHEGEPVAKWLNSIGISAIILHYRVVPHQHPAPLHDAQTAIRMARINSEKWNIDPNRVGILGFSAGGHLASSAGTLFEKGDEFAEGLINRYSTRPDLMILCYPVITMGSPQYIHEGSKLNLLGEQPGLSLVRKMSTEKQVTAETPPAFLWHTADDAAVSVENSLMFARSLGKFDIPYALHIFESGKHGLGLAEEHSEAKLWPKLCEAWLKNRSFI